MRLTRLLAKNGLSGLGQPGGQPGAAVGGLGGSSKTGPPRALGFITLPVRGWRTSPDAGGEDDLVVGQAALLAADLREEGGEAVVVVLGPALERVVVALGALDADAEEELGRRLDRALRVAADPVVVGRRVREGRAVGRQQLADELVHRHVPLEARADPAVEDVGPLGLDQPAVGPEHVGELQGPEVVELGPVEQPVDRAWSRRSAAASARNASTSSGVGRTPIDVEVDAADELARRCRPRTGLIRIRLSFAKTARSIDVVLRDLGDLEAGHLDQVGQPDVGDEVEVVGDDGDLAARLEGDVAVGVDLGDLGVRRVVVADRRDVADGAVGVVDAGRRAAGSSPGR